MKYVCNLSAIACLLLLMTSCGNVKNLQYMQGSFDTAKLSSYSIPEPVIQKGDLMGIVVYSDNPGATTIYNQSLTGGTTVSASTLPTASAPGYLVDNEGNIQFQGVGKLQVEGLTKAGLASLLNTKLKDILLTNPYYNIRFLNYKITIIGDVAKPSVYSVPSEKVNILEALSLAGDLNITARRDNVRVIREENGKRTFGVIDLRQPDIFNNNFYYLHQNDIVYVDFTKQKAASSDQTTVRNITIATSIVSTIAIIISVLRR
ncbi:MAG: polysaccharide biosynthesis/export family protein [Ferruginibacter sp.]